MLSWIILSFGLAKTFRLFCLKLLGTHLCSNSSQSHICWPFSAHYYHRKGSYPNIAFPKAAQQHSYSDIGTHNLAIIFAIKRRSEK